MRDHGGQIRALAENLAVTLPEGPIHDFSASLNPLGMPPPLQGIVDVWQQQSSHYPSPEADAACRALALVHDLDPKQVLCGNGSTELFALALLASKVKRCTGFPPCWSGYQEACHSAGVVWTEGHSWEQVADHEAMIVASPNNPDGTLIDAAQLKQFCKNRPHVLVLLDLAFDDFLWAPSESPWWQGSDWPANLIRIQSLTKFFGIPGIRLGFLATGNGSNAELLAMELRHRSLPWNVNGIAQWCAERLYADLTWHQMVREATVERRSALQQVLNRHGFSTTPCAAWILASPPQGFSAESMQRTLLCQGICVRRIGSDQLRFGIPSTQAIEALQHALSEKTARKQTPAILIAGTSSDAGKSILAAGLCAVLRKYGFNPAPFKAQNMSNQAWVTREGGEIGWAQAVQAIAAGMEPHTDMNPILLKPGSLSRSHVVVNGMDTGSASVQEYYDCFAEMRSTALEAYDRLASKAGIMVLEGAGGIAEINLRHRDLSNREAPLHAQAKIVITTDIERGGAFASLYGSWAMLEDSLRAQVCGFVINRFRGDATLLDSGIRELEQRTGVPVLGVIPYMEHLQLGEEDSMGFDEEPLPPSHLLRIGVVRLPHMANGNDWMWLKSLPGIGVFCSSDCEALSCADVLIVPGTRSTIADLRWLRSHKMDELILSHVHAYKPILAICGGMQMLGQLILDPEGAEGTPSENEIGLGIFPLQTILQSKSKTVQNCTTTVSPTIASDVSWLQQGIPVEGYEIHCGVSIITEESTRGAWLDGWIAEDGRLWGTYWHGILNQPDLLIPYAKQLFIWANKPVPDTFHFPSKASYLETGIQQVQELVEAHMDWRRLL